MSSVRIPPVLRAEAGGQRSVDVEATTVRGAIEALVAQYPSLRDRLLADGDLPAFVNVFVDGDDVRLLSGLETPVAPSSTIVLLPAVAGGSGLTAPVRVSYPGWAVPVRIEKPKSFAYTLLIACAREA